MIRVLLVDDHAMLRAGFRAILSTQPDIEVVGEASTGAEGVRLAAELQPDVITMDVQMPDMDGIEATRRIVADPAVGASIAIVTTFDRDEYLFQALDAGAGGFLLKNAGPEELITAVRALAAGEGILAPEVTRRVLSRFSMSGGGASAGSATQGGSSATQGAGSATQGAGSATQGAGSATQGGSSAAQGAGSAAHGVLTDRESEVLALMADARSNAEIARELFIGEATVKTHVSRVLQKLGARDRVQAIVLAHRHGLTR
ncbi:response regulator [Microbacterium sp. NPDC055312]